MGTFTNDNPTPLDPTGWRLTFVDGFDGAMVDSAAWPVALNGFRYWNNAFAWSTSALNVWDGELLVSNIASPSGWVAGGLNMGWNGQLYGRFEVRARLDEGKGTSAAILLWPTDGHYPPEIDLLESPDPRRTISSMTVHGENGTDGKQVNSNASQWHTYAVDWLPDHLTFYIDGVAQWTTTARVPHEPMSLGFMGFVASSADEWFGGAPDASTPGLVSLHVDWARIWTPASLYPGELPSLLYGVPGQGWVPAPATVHTGVRSIGEDRYQATWNAAEYGAVPAVGRDYTHGWVPGSTANHLLFANFEEVQLPLNDAPIGLDVQVIGAAFGTLITGNGNDKVTWVAHGDAAARRLDSEIWLAEGNDTLLVTTPARAWQWQPFDWGPRWNPGYDGQLSTVRVIGGGGNDHIELQGRMTSGIDTGPGNDRIIGGSGSDGLRGGTGADDLTGGAGADLFIYVQGEGGDIIRDFTPGLDHIVMFGISPGSVATHATANGFEVAANGEFIALLVGVTALQPNDLIFG